MWVEVRHNEYRLLLWMTSMRARKSGAEREAREWRGSRWCGLGVGRKVAGRYCGQ